MRLLFQPRQGQWGTITDPEGKCELDVMRANLANWSMRLACLARFMPHPIAWPRPIIGWPGGAA